MSKGIFMYSDAFKLYNMGPHHPLNPLRLYHTYELLRTYGAFTDVKVVEPTLCALEILRNAHSARYIDYIAQLDPFSNPPTENRYGVESADNPYFPNIWEASLRYTGASYDAADAIVSGRTNIAMNISGGLHHAHYDSAAGFCVFNDCVIAIKRLRERYSRVAYIDIDVHHADGVQEAFYSDPSVLTVSIHESGRTLYPGTGDVREIGEGDGVGYSVNIPLTPQCSSAVWYKAFHEGALPIIDAYHPEAVCLQLGTDAHYLDPLAHLCVTAQGWLKAVSDIKALDVPILALGGGGYNPTTVPRMWTLAYGVLFGIDMSDDTPEDFVAHDIIPTLTDHAEPNITLHDNENAQQNALDVVDTIKKQLISLHNS